MVKPLSVFKGGKYLPKDCASVNSVATVVGVVWHQRTILSVRYYTGTLYEIVYELSGTEFQRDYTLLEEASLVVTSGEDGRAVEKTWGQVVLQRAVSEVVGIAA